MHADIFYLEGAEVGSLETHPLSEFAPVSTKVDVRGEIRNPIVLLDGRVFDGRARVAAAARDGLRCPCVRYQERDRHPAMVIANTAAARLSKQQCAVQAVRMLALFASRPEWLSRLDPSMPDRVTRTHEGRVLVLDAFGVSERNYQRAKALPDDLLDAVFDHCASLPNAFSMRDLPSATRRRVLGHALPDQRTAINRALAKHRKPVMARKWIKNFDAAEIAAFLEKQMGHVRKFKP
ncbi:hypothetical protein G3N95_24095 [Paraburkholderia sp. Tr-20389]|uniref:hypothetical protein n=1 Tax=Paraburkholderia sp. Tr-20389 TaxID=2703903 RepID=UPI001982074E|nr:hypothetical protein [Paraburkholderia sp. Tr-20389]MBN3756045.1 hypothetical protein [Paraburkholderia sp. Tr-20389]